MSNGLYDSLKESIALSEAYRVLMQREPKRSGSGSKFSGFCPSHEDKNNPSMSMDDDLGLWYCFTCGAGGDVIHFWKEARNKSSNHEAALDIADSFHVSVDRYVQQDNVPSGPSAKRIREALTELAQKAHKRIASSDEWAPKDDLADAAITEFEDRFHKNAIASGVPHSLASLYLLGTLPEIGTAKWIIDVMGRDEAFASGMVVKKEKDGRSYTYSPFANRLLVPIFNDKGEVIAFGGRRVDEMSSSKSKWINPTNTSVYNKSDVLFGLDQVQKGDTVIITEGYLDAISITSSASVQKYLGDNYVGVAVCGTALTKAHVKALKRAGARDILLMFDGDSGGRKALSRSIWIANDFQDAKVVVLDEGNDPFDTEFGPSRTGRRLAGYIENPSNLPRSAVQARFTDGDGDVDAFDRWVAETLSSMSYTEHKDDIIKEAMRLREMSLSSYTATINGISSGIRSRVKIEDGDEDGASSLRLTPNNEALIKRLMQLDTADRMGVLATMLNWTPSIEEAIRETIGYTEENPELLVACLERLATGRCTRSTFDEADINRYLASLIGERYEDVGGAEDIRRYLQTGVMTFKVFSIFNSDPYRQDSLIRCHSESIMRLNGSSEVISKQIAAVAHYIDANINVYLRSRSAPRAEDSKTVDTVR